ncbi:MAG: hypothetical protein NUV81_03920, partial [bacterium]|nr:hypothetical protein [bacterium]
MIRSSHHTPVYRHVIREAFEVAWHEKSFWLLSFFAGALATAGVYDVIWKASTNITVQGSTLAKRFGSAIIYSITSTAVGATSVTNRVIHILGSVELFSLIALLFVAGFIFSCLAQGGLVYALGGKMRGRKPTLKESFSVGGKALWPVIA